jgi:hypothetical protein
MLHKHNNKLITFGRCAYLDPARRRCRSLIIDPDSTSCPHHSVKQLHDTDYASLLMSRAHHFRCATGINNAISGLYELLAMNGITAARANALTRLITTALRTLPLIEQEREHAPCRRASHSATSAADATLRDLYNSRSAPPAETNSASAAAPKPAPTQKSDQPAPGSVRVHETGSPKTSHPSAKLTVKDVDKLAALTRKILQHETVLHKSEFSASKVPSPRCPTLEVQPGSSVVEVTSTTKTLAASPSVHQPAFSSISKTAGDPSPTPELQLPMSKPSAAPLEITPQPIHEPQHSQPTQPPPPPPPPLPMPHQHLPVGLDPRLRLRSKFIPKRPYNYEPDPFAPSERQKLR